MEKTLTGRIEDYLANGDDRALLTALVQARGAGHTEAMLQVAEKIGATVVFAIHGQTLPYRDRFPNVKFQTLLTLQNGSGAGCDGPVLFDNSVWKYLGELVGNSSALLREAARKMEQIEAAVTGA